MTSTSIETMSSQRNAVIYARLSKDIAKTGAGVERQLADARQLAHLRGWAIIAEHVDNDLSASGKRVRPGFEALIEDVRSGHADVVVAWAWDRLSRNRRDQLRLIEVGQEARAIVALVRGSGDLDMSNANGRFVADMFAGISRQEIDAKSERQERAGIQRAEAGLPPARRAFGYNQDGTLHPVEAPAVAETFALLLAGSTVVGLTRHLNVEGHTTTRGRPWIDSAVKCMLRNPRYAGERYYRGEWAATGEWEPLVSAETFAAVQAILDDPARRASRPARRYLGSNLFLCWCGARTKTTYANGGNRVYVCRARRHMQRNAEPVDKVVYGVIAAWLRRPDNIKKLAEHKSAQGVVTKLRQDAIGLRARLDTLGLDYAEGHLTGREVAQARQRIEANLADVESKLAEAGRGSALSAVIGADDPGDAWLGLPLDRQRAVLAEVVTVRILKGKVGRGSFDPETVFFDWKES
jgi:site-specific DNA recombinase